MPTRSEPTRPGPSATAIALRSSSRVADSSSASRTAGTIALRCSRDASSGTTPPYFECVAICEETTDDKIRDPSSTTAAAVSSHDDSIPRIRILVIGVSSLQWSVERTARGALLSPKALAPRCVVRDHRGNVLLSDFDYHLPDDLIAQEPLPARAGSRMLVVDRAAGTWRDSLFREFPG